MGSVIAIHSTENGDYKPVRGKSHPLVNADVPVIPSKLPNMRWQGGVLQLRIYSSVYPRCVAQSLSTTFYRVRLTLRESPLFFICGSFESRCQNPMKKLGEEDPEDDVRRTSQAQHLIFTTTESTQNSNGRRNTFCSCVLGEVADSSGQIHCCCAYHLRFTAANPGNSYISFTFCSPLSVRSPSPLPQTPFHSTPPPQKRTAAQTPPA